MRAAPAIACLLALAACEQVRYDPGRATRPYPFELHTTEVVDIQVFREEQNLVIVNSTARSYSGFDIWVNQRFMLHVDHCPAGHTLVLRLDEFFDERGDAIIAGGFWRSREATPVRLVEAQPGPGEPLVGLIVLRAEDIP